ncbi:MAG: AAA-like domain-containing protein [Chloroflexota bacterium]
MRTFNTAGPIETDYHYYLPPLERFELDQIEFLIHQRKYFILHAPRQVGKTTFMLSMMDYLNSQGDYRCLYINLETAQASRENVNQAMTVIIGEMASQAKKFLGDPFIDDMMIDAIAKYDVRAFSELLALWSDKSDKPLVLLLDEVDALVGDTLISLLRQLRAGYANRPKHFPQSIILCGVRDIRDYRIHSSAEKTIITGGSAFNIKVESLRMNNFNQADVHDLYQQHTDETGQTFTPDALALIWELTRGQPWLVNALGYEICFRTPEARRYRGTVTAEMIQIAKEDIIKRREVHLDQLTDKLKEGRVRRVIAPMLSGTSLDENVQDDDIQYVVDLGLVHRGPDGLEIANPIYREVIPRTLNYITQLNFESTIKPHWYIAPDGRLDMNKLMTAFQNFFRENSEHWLKRFQYQEAGPQLLLQAFLQRIVNGGGRIEREYGLGLARTDLFVVWSLPSDEDTPDLSIDNRQKVVIETKIRYGDLEKTIKAGLKQTWQYMDKANTAEGHLVIFDRSTTKSWGEKVFQRKETFNNDEIIVWGM